MKLWRRFYRHLSFEKKRRIKVNIQSEMSEAIKPIHSSPKSIKRRYEEEPDVEGDNVDVKKPPMPTYGKYNILKILKENHCLIADNDDQLVNAFQRKKRYDENDIKSFINKSARKSQTIIEKNNKSIEFKRSQELIKTIQARIPLSDRSLDLPLSLKTLTDVFNYEEKDLTDAFNCEEEKVDLRMLYQTLTNLSLGFPTSQLDNTTSSFLYGIYKEFLGQINTPQFQEDVQKYQHFFNSNVNMNESFDVKHAAENSDMNLVIKNTFNCPSINPLKIPYSLLHKPKNSN